MSISPRSFSVPPAGPPSAGPQPHVVFKQIARASKRVARVTSPCLLLFPVPPSLYSPRRRTRTSFTRTSRARRSRRRFIARPLTARPLPLISPSTAQAHENLIYLNESRASLEAEVAALRAELRVEFSDAASARRALSFAEADAAEYKGAPPSEEITKIDTLAKGRARALFWDEANKRIKFRAVVRG